MFGGWVDMISGDRWMISDTKGFTKNTPLYFVNNPSC
jgi:hypothetical protein